MRLSISLLCKILPKSSYYVSTPIFYVNGEPHIGHLHTLLLADVLHRYHKLRGCSESIFSTGTDEHGLKVQRAADYCQMKPLDFCDKISGKFLNLCEAFDINPTHFIRTTDPLHKKSVQKFWDTLSKNGYIYKSHYEGWYSVPDETFVGPHDIEERVVNDKKVKVFSQTGHVLEWLREENYMFRLSGLLGELKHWLASTSVSIKPTFFHQYLISVIDKGLDDLSISRPKSRLEWGIPVPNDDSQIIYVWLDALVNYLTVSGYPNELRIWPPDCHVIGKDIINFHAIYWPAFLMAAGLEPPKTILCHSHWTVNDVKMSKSKGNVVNPHDLIEPFSVDGVRYYFIRQAVPSHDANFSPLQMKRFLNSELADTLGNLLLRSTAPAINIRQIYPATPSDHELSSLPGISEILDSLATLKNKVEEQFEKANFSRGLADMMHPVRLTNKLFDEIKPWILVKNDPDSGTLTSAIYIALEVIRINAILLQPIVPSYSEKLLSKLGVAREESLWSYSVPYLGARSREESALNTIKIIPFKKIR